MTANARSMDLITAVDGLDDLLEGGARLPGSARARVGRGALVDAVAELRAALDEQTGRADAIETERAAILADAQRTVERLDADASRRRDRLLAEHPLPEQARAWARAVVEDAEAQAREDRRRARGYAADVLGALEANLDRLRARVQVARDVLAERRERDFAVGGDARAPTDGGSSAAAGGSADGGDSAATAPDLARDAA